ncbi:MAG: ABC transporter ATP-binding protein [Coriobacteriales bacterium]|jgi:ABC-2 type transport system ATP-binding protein|nr:ABC transporter ATP-binding protein [Coriobacteriales bacterium]
MNILEIKSLYKSFGKHDVLTGLDMQVPEHSVYGFVGQNGSGKTTTMKIVLGLLRANQGEVYVCGEKASYGETKTNRHIGFLPDVPEFYNFMRPMEYLSLCREITGLTNKQISKRGEDLLTLVGLADDKRKIGGFSRGMKQRLGIAQALLNNPRLLICDEPTSALDPIGRKEILDILAAVKGRTTVVFSTHVLSDVERICDQVAVLHQGKLALSGTLAEIKASHRQGGYIIEFATIEEATSYAKAALLHLKTINVEQDKGTLIVKASDTRHAGDQLISLFANLQTVPLKFEVMEPTLEGLFTEVVQ